MFKKMKMQIAEKEAKSPLRPQGANQVIRTVLFIVKVKSPELTRVKTFIHGVPWHRHSLAEAGV